MLADAWYPGWRVWIDGVEGEPLRAFGFLKAVAVAPGRHKVEWKYEPLSFRIGAAVSVLGLFAAGLALAWSRLSKRRRRQLG